MHDELSAGGVADQPQRGVNAWCERPAELEAHQLGDGVVGAIGWRRLVAEAAVALVAAAEPAKALRPLVGVDLNAAQAEQDQEAACRELNAAWACVCCEAPPRMLHTLRAPEALGSSRAGYESWGRGTDRGYSTLQSGSGRGRLC